MGHTRHGSGASRSKTKKNFRAQKSFAALLARLLITGSLRFVVVSASLGFVRLLGVLFPLDEAHAASVSRNPRSSVGIAAARA